MTVVNGTVTEIFTEGYIEVAIWENDKPGQRRCVAETDEKKQRRGDIVELRPAKPTDEPIARLAYLMAPALFALGLLLNRGALLDKVLSGAILGFLGFVMAWLMNRRARLRRRLEYRVSRTIQESPDHV